MKPGHTSIKATLLPKQLSLLQLALVASACLIFVSSVVSASAQSSAELIHNVPISAGLRGVACKTDYQKPGYPASNHCHHALCCLSAENDEAQRIDTLIAIIPAVIGSIIEEPNQSDFWPVNRSIFVSSIFLGNLTEPRGPPSQRDA